MLRILFNLANVAHFIYAIQFVRGVKIPGRDLNGGEWKFLTFWNLWIQLIYFSIGLCNELYRSISTKSSRLQKLRDYLFSTVSFPLGVWVTTMFWSLYAVDRNLIFPKMMDKFYPPWFCHMVHTTCMLSQLIEMKTSFHQYSTRIKGMLASMSISLVYILVILYIAFVGNFWVYPFMRQLSGVGCTIFLSLSCVSSGLLYLGGELLNKMLWPAATKSNTTVRTESAADGGEPTNTYNTRSRKKLT